jgi:hypothetical protein
MNPSQLSRSLRLIASKIDRSKRPDRALVSRDLRRVLANMSNSTIYRLVSDEPIGFCIGFKPSDEFLEENGFDADEWTLTSDSGGSDIFGSEDGPTVVFDGNEGNSVKIIDHYPSQQEIEAGQHPVGPEMSIWRSEDELQEYLDDLNN